MKRTFFIASLLFLLLNSITGTISACTLQLTPASFSVKPGGDVSFNLERTRTSDQCPDSAEAAAITVTGGDITDSGSWKTGNPDSLDFKIKFDGVTPPIVNVTYNCNITGIISVQAKGTTDAISNTSSEASPITNVVKKPSGISKSAGVTPLPSTKPLEPETASGKLEETSNNDRDALEILFAQICIIWGSSPPGLKLWYLFILAGLLLYFFKLKQLRKPLLFLSIIVLGFLMNDFANPNPILFQLFTAKINYHTVLPFLLIPVIISIFFGRFFCGWVCPVGAIQEFMSPDEKKRILPALADRILKYFKYILLFLLIFLLNRHHLDLWSSYDPFKTLFGFGGTVASIIILVFVLFVSVFVERPFCRYVCPMGAILSITSRISLIKMRADANKCMVCGRCTAGECPMDALSAFNPEVDLPTVDSAECIYCFRCQKQCRKKALHVTGFRIDHVSSLVGKSEDK